MSRGALGDFSSPVILAPTGRVGEEMGLFVGGLVHQLRDDIAKEGRVAFGLWVRGGCVSLRVLVMQVELLLPVGAFVGVGQFFARLPLRLGKSLPAEGYVFRPSTLVAGVHIDLVGSVDGLAFGRFPELFAAVDEYGLGVL